MRKFFHWVLTATVLSFTLAARAQTSGQLNVHEWGTFTSLQDEKGNALSGIAEDVEPLPSFVQNLVPGADLKGTPSSINKDVTMRLETPVVYFHPPAGQALPKDLKFSVTFNGGYVSQWYPTASNDTSPANVRTITEKTQNTLTWGRLALGSSGKFPETTSNVWLAPRNVNAANVTVNGQTERYLFYRGVAHLDSPISVIRTGDSLRAVVRENVSSEDVSEYLASPAWLVDIRQDGACAYRELRIGNPRSTANVSVAAEFAAADYQGDQLAALQKDMKAYLISSGLFDDEAQAMLNTWRESYFKSAGTRVFFIVPRTWTDRVLPIKLSVPAQIERVMVGRIDIVTPRQRELAKAFWRQSEAKDPRSVETSRQIGRFSSAIIADEKARTAPVSAIQP